MDRPRSNFLQSIQKSIDLVAIPFGNNLHATILKILHEPSHCELPG
jgi:hypothetical protein